MPVRPVRTPGPAGWLAAGLTVLRAYHLAGRPKAKLPGWGSFEGWSGLVRQAVVFAGQPDPADTRAELRDTADTDGLALRRLIEGIDKLDLSRKGLTAAEIVKAVGQEAEPSDWRSALLEAVDSLCDGKPDSKKLGYKLRHFHKRRVNQRFLDVRMVGGSRRWFACGSKVEAEIPDSVSMKSIPGTQSISGRQAKISFQ